MELQTIFSNGEYKANRGLKTKEEFNNELFNLIR